MDLYKRLSLFDIFIISLSVVLVFSRIIKFVPEYSATVYYSGIAFLTVCIVVRTILKGFNISFSKITLLLITFCGVSIIANKIHPVFQAEQRFVGWCLIVVAVGPLLNNRYNATLKMAMLNAFVGMFVAISVLSFFTYLVSPESMLTERGSLFGGYTTHSMLMGPMAAIASLWLGITIIVKFRELTIPIKVLYISTLSICILTSVLAGSRAALLAGILAFLCWYWQYSNHSVKKSLRLLIATSIIIAISAPVWIPYTEAIQKKMEYAENKGSLTASRNNLWEQRFDEIEHDPIFGCGFATTELVTLDGKVEPGNGWLFVFSSSGIGAFICICILFFSLIRFAWRRNTSAYNLKLFSLLCYCGIHQCAEGYIISSGAFFCFFLWLLFGATQGLKSIKSNHTEHF